MGLANSYKRFMKGFAQVARPITNLSCTNKFKWKEQQRSAFEELERRLITVPVLRHPSSEDIFVLTTYALKYAVGATMEQKGQPFSFLSHRLSETKTRWDTGHQELLAVMIALREWAVYLKDCPFIIRTDHEPIKYLQTKSKLLARQMRWLHELQCYSFKVEPIKGSKMEQQMP